MTYEVEGRQYIAVASGKPSLFAIQDSARDGSIIVYALPN